MYEFLRILFTWFFCKVCHTEITGTENMPPEGGVILAANHLSNWDPPFLGTFILRPVSYMAKKELFDIPVFSRCIIHLHAFPVKRGAADRGAIKAALAALGEGRCVGLFPEGTRSRDGEVHKAEAGVALLAAKSGVPVVPAAITGTNRIFSRGSFFPALYVSYGAPLRFEGRANDRAALERFSEKIMEEIVKMKKKHSKEIP